MTAAAAPRPVEVSPGGDYAEAARRLVTQPDVWLRINAFDVAHRARAFARDIAEQRFSGFLEIASDMEVEVVGCDVYALYFGSAQLRSREMAQ